MSAAAELRTRKHDGQRASNNVSEMPLEESAIGGETDMVVREKMAIKLKKKHKKNKKIKLTSMERTGPISKYLDPSNPTSRVTSPTISIE